jgi:hypothetical protein
MASFMNGERGRYLSVAAFERAELDESPGHCVFWFARESPPIHGNELSDDARIARLTAAGRLLSDPAARCDSYTPRWDPSGTQILCRRCR